MQRRFKLRHGDQVFFQGLGHFTDVHHLDKTVRVDDYIRKEIGDNKRILLFIKVMGNNVAVIVEQPVIGRIEFAYFVALPEIITGKAMVEILSWSDCLPAGYQNPGFVQKNPVVFEKNAFFRYQTSSVQNGGLS